MLVNKSKPPDPEILFGILIILILSQIKRRSIKSTIYGYNITKPELKRWLNFAIIDKNAQQLRGYHKVYSEWFETPSPGSIKSKNAVEYLI